MHTLGTYLVNGIAGNENVAGTPMLSFSLVVVSGTGKVSGHAMITQAIAPPNNEKTINNVTGQVHATGLGPVTKVVTLQGTYLDDLPPPAIGTIEVPFTAHFAIDDAWNGRGGFKCGYTQAENVPVKTTPR
jgi:ABC-type Fe3+-hydroxamate transport system substrate-binding protein